MEIKSYNIKELKKALETNELWEEGEVPISKHKVISHIHNPRAKEDDVVLIVARKENNIIGYIGILPEKIFIDGREQDFGWLTCWWVDPLERKSRAGILLLFKAINLYDNNIGISDFTEHAKTVYDASNKFVLLKERTELKIFVRLNLHQILPSRFPYLSRFTNIFKISDNIINFFIDLKNNFSKKKLIKRNDINIEYIDVIDNEVKDFIINNKFNELSNRNADELNWITHYPWVITAPEQDFISKRYKFLSISKSFYYLKIKVYDKNHTLCGFLILRKRDNEITVPYLYFKKNYIKVVAEVIFYHLFLLKADLLITTNRLLTDEIENSNFSKLFIRKNKKYAYINNKYANIDFNQYHLQDGDGDNAFT